MHLLIPFASSSSEGCRQALSSLELPHLEKLLRRLTPGLTDSGDETSLSPPHERVLARALGLPVDDGLIPWAALQAQTSVASAETGAAWAFISPCHWLAGAKHVAMGGLTLPDFGERESQALLAAMQPYFSEDNIALHYEQPGRWLACGELFRDLPTASLERVAGRELTPWLPRAIPLQRLQSEMQMLLYHHPVNDDRAARGVPAVNSFWVSGTGDLPASSRQAATVPKPVVVTRLRTAALDEDWPAWVQAWQALDATECRALLGTLNQGGSAELTLCGERSARSWQAQPRSLLQKLMSQFGTRPLSSVLDKL